MLWLFLLNYIVLWSPLFPTSFLEKNSMMLSFFSFSNLWSIEIFLPPCILFEASQPLVLRSDPWRCRGKCQFSISYLQGFFFTLPWIFMKKGERLVTFLTKWLQTIDPTQFSNPFYMSVFFWSSRNAGCIVVDFCKDDLTPDPKMHFGNKI